MDLRPLQVLADTYCRRQALVAHWQPRLEAVRCLRQPGHLSMQDYLLLRLQPEVVTILYEIFFPYEDVPEPVELDVLLSRLSQQAASRCVVARQALNHMERQPSQALQIYQGLSRLDREQVLHWCLEPPHHQLWLQLRSQVSDLSESDRQDLLEEAISLGNLEAVAWLRPLVRLNLRNPNVCYQLRQAIFESNHYPFVAQFGPELCQADPRELEKATAIEFLVDYVEGFLHHQEDENPYHPVVVKLFDQQLRLGRSQWLAYLMKTFPGFSLATGIFLKDYQTIDGYAPTADLYHVLRSGNPELVALVLENLLKFSS